MTTPTHKKLTISVQNYRVIPPVGGGAYDAPPLRCHSEPTHRDIGQDTVKRSKVKISNLVGADVSAPYGEILVVGRRSFDALTLAQDDRIIFNSLEGRVLLVR